MTTAEMVKLIFLIKQLYPGKNGFEPLNKEELRKTAETWAMMLEDIDFSLARAALRRHSNSSQFAPSIAEIRRNAVLELNPGKEITGDEAWEIVLSGVRKYGYGRKQEAIAQMPEAVQPMAQRWFDEIGMTESDVLGVTRGQFIKSWDIHAQREREHKQLPGGISQMVSALRERMSLPEG